MIAAIAAWFLYTAIYAVTFALSGAIVADAIRGALANGIPDGLLALAVLATARRIDRPESTPGGLLRRHVPLAVLLVGLAFAAKTLLIFIDVTLVRGPGSYRFGAQIATWQIFLSGLIYLSVSASAHAWRTAALLREEEARAARAETLRSRAEMTALRAQLNPHFLFNTLHSVLGLVRRDPALAEAAIEKLGDLLHYAISVHRDGVDWTALRHEWRFMETYLELETYRLGERLRVSRSVEESALEQPVPTFSLQPLVENAVRHGIAPRAAGGRISVESRVEGSTLRLRVTNDGNDGGAASETDEGGLGLRVLRDRLEVLYRGLARMTAGPTAEGGFDVILELPLRAIETENGP